MQTMTCLQEAAKGLARNPIIFLLAVMLLLAFVAFMSMIGASLVYMNCIPEMPSLRYMFIYLIFSTLWISFFLSAVLQATVGGAIAMWYFSRSASASERWLILLYLTPQFRSPLLSHHSSGPCQPRLVLLHLEVFSLHLSCSFVL
jgi:hypothetical protein